MSEEEENISMDEVGEEESHHSEIHETHEEVIDSGDNGSHHSSSSSGSGSGETTFCQSIGCSIIGFIVILACTVGHYKNEQAAVERSELYAHVQKTAVLANSENGNLDGKLIHLTSKIDIDSKYLQDKQFKVKAKCVKLERVVQMWQTCERVETKTKKKKTVKTYFYDDQWSSTYCDHTTFHEQKSKYKNKPFNLKSETVGTSKVSVKKINLDPEFTSQISWLNDAESKLQNPIFKDNNLRKNARESKPRKGDYKIYWNCYGKQNDEVSVLGKVENKNLVSYVTEIRVLWSKFETKPLHELVKGSQSLETMVDDLKAESKMIVWILRFVLFVAIIGGSVAFWGPLSHLLDKIPCCGDFLSGIVDFFAGVAGFLWSLFVCILCWCLVRPWLLLAFIIILVICIAGIVAYKKMSPKKGKGEKTDEEAE